MIMDTEAAVMANLDFLANADVDMDDDEDMGDDVDIETTDDIEEDVKIGKKGKNREIHFPQSVMIENPKRGSWIYNFLKTVGH